MNVQTVPFWVMLASGIGAVCMAYTLPLTSGRKRAPWVVLGIMLVLFGALLASALILLLTLDTSCSLDCSV